jgi:PAS domain S-box-containing protein
MTDPRPDYAQIVDVLAAAVTIRDPHDHIIYANRAALDDLGFATLEELQRRPPGDIMADYVVRDELGQPLTMDAVPSVRLLRGEQAPPLLMRIVHRRSGVVQWKLLKASPLTDEQGAIFATATIIEDVTEPKTAELHNRLLAEASMILASSLDYAQTLRNVAWSAVPQLADWCAVDLFDSAGKREHVAVAHADPERLAIAERLREREPRALDPDRGLGKVLRTGRSELLAEIPDAMLVASARDQDHLSLLRAVDMRSVLLVALRTPLRTIGVMTFVMSDSRRTFSAQDLEFAEQLASRAAVAVENAMLYRGRAQIAETLQRSLLPDGVPVMAGWDVATLYRPAGGEHEVQVGGDFFDFVELVDSWLVIIGDVTGKGLQAASLTSLVRHCARFQSRIDSRPSAVLAAIDEALVEHGSLSLCTALCLRVSADEILYCSAGHPTALATRPAGEPREAGGHDRLLGLPGAAGWHDELLELAADETLILYTDGVTDAIGAADRFGEDRLRAVLRDHADAPPQVLLAELDAALAAFAVGPQADDTAAVALTRSAADAASESVTRTAGAASSRTA